MLYTYTVISWIYMEYRCMLYTYTVISWIYMEYSVYVIHVYCYIVDIYGILSVCFSTDTSNYKVIQ